MGAFLPLIAVTFYLAASVICLELFRAVGVRVPDAVLPKKP